MKKNLPIVQEAHFASTPVYLYDMSIKEVQERSSKKIMFNSIGEAAKYLMQPERNLAKPLDSGPNRKLYCYHRITRAKYAIRRAKEIA